MATGYLNGWGELGVEGALPLDGEVGPGHVQAVVTGEYSNHLTDSEIASLWRDSSLIA